MGVGVDDLRGGHHRIHRGMPGHGDPVLGFEPHDAMNAHLLAVVLVDRSGYRYWPVLATLSMLRPGPPPVLPWISVRMKTIRSPFLPEMRAQSSGFVVLGRSSFSRNSSTQASSRCCTRMPFSPVFKKSLIADFLARETMFSSMAPELKSLK